jgi:phenylalanyl-tRNA synthetase beta chain
MLVSLSWLKKYVELPDDTARLVEDLTMTGLNVEGRTARGFSDPNVIVGHVLEVEKHPNADKLTVCRVDTGDGEPRGIVCGAPNVAAGQTVLVALPGAKLPGGLKIRASKIRGVKSDGMICSEIELGIGDDAAGIMVLDGNFDPGVPMTQALPAPDEVLEIEVTPNRPDQLSYVGIAREVAAIYDVPMTMPFDASKFAKAGGRTDFKVAIEVPQDCARYVGKRVSGIKVAPSPPWLAEALESVGLQSVNNVVDITNFVLMELGQPIHAFDFKKLKGSKIVVRRGDEGEKLLALDGETHELDADTLVIGDGKTAVALAGVIGGEESAVHADTTELLVESANFDAKLVRRTRTRLGINTDASYRFERGVDRELPRAAAERAVELICQVAGGKPGPVLDVYPNPWKSPAITIRSAATQRILGTQIATEDIEQLLARLGFQSRERTEGSVTVAAPSYRVDIHEEADLIEEVARLYGYNRIGAGWAYRCTTFGRTDPFDAFVESVCDHATSRGMSEIVASSFTDGSELEDYGWQQGDPRLHPIAIRNPLNANHSYLRTSLLPSMLATVRRNIDYGVRRIAIYQAGRVFLTTESHEQLPNERMMLTLVLSRQESDHFWHNSRDSLELYDIKAEVDVLLKVFNVDLGRDIDYTFDESSGRFTYQTKQEVLIEGGIVSDAVTARYDIEQPVWHVTFDVEGLYQRVLRGARFTPLGDYPSSKRDLSLVSRQGTRFEDIEKSLVKSAGPLLESLQVFDVYSGEHLVGGHMAYGVRLNFRSADRTLTDKEVDGVIEKILTKLKNQLGVELRS